METPCDYNHAIDQNEKVNIIYGQYNSINVNFLRVLTLNSQFEVKIDNRMNELSTIEHVTVSSVVSIGRFLRSQSPSIENETNNYGSPYKAKQM